MIDFLIMVWLFFKINEIIFDEWMNCYFNERMIKLKVAELLY